MMPVIPSTEVDTTAGKIRGSFENGLFIFRGIPYASPPVGPLRWHPPQPYPAWTGVRDALSFGLAAPQPASKADSIQEFAVSDVQSEDCLFLNIWTPGLDSRKRPVMVWIHGGYFTMGSGSQSAFKGNSLAGRGDVVVITLNYRLGVLGFINLKEVTAGRIPATGNEGLLDQIAALRWIGDNVAKFGGDPDNITVFGESAGGTSIQCLMAMPQARGLFRRAIVQSLMGQAVRPLKDAVSAAEIWLRRLGLNGEDFSLLESLPLEKILWAQKSLSSRTSWKMVPIAPVIDGEVLPASPLDIIRSKKTSDISVLIGTNREEMRLFSALSARPDFDESILKQRLRRLVPDINIDNIIASYRRSLDQAGVQVTSVRLLDAIQTDIMFRIPAMEFLQACCQSQRPAFGYFFTWESPAENGVYGACHGLEIGFVFGNHGNGFCGTGPAADQLAWRMQEAWTTFARTGDPSCPSLGKWPQYCDRHQTMLLGVDSRIAEDPFYPPLLTI